MSYRDWHVGMKVVCVDASGRMPSGISLNEGRVYTLTSIRRDFFFDQQDRRIRLTVAVTLEGFPSEARFRASRFRPVQPRKTDISIFEAMLNGAPMQKELS